jgi:hypothetical protein
MTWCSEKSHRERPQHKRQRRPEQQFPVISPLTSEKLEGKDAFYGKFM